MTSSRPKKSYRRRSKRPPEEPVIADIETLSAEGRGITHIDQQPVFIDHALKGEKVLFKYTRKTKKIAEGITLEVLHASDERVQPNCNVFQYCGGCSLQHMKHEAQLALKQQTLLDQLNHVGNVTAENILPALTGPIWAYRTKARLGVRYVAKKDRVLVGFRERGSSFITDTERCEILHPSVGTIIKDLSDMISQLALRQRIPQIEVAVGDDVSTLVLRHLEPLPETDLQVVKAFAKKHKLAIMLQPGSPDQLIALWPQHAAPLFYTILNDTIKIAFDASDFTQVNPDINRSMVDQVLTLFQLRPSDRVLDLFCGLGNFSLPIATQCAHVTGVEGSAVMVNKARNNAELNHIDNAEFVHTDLYQEQVLTAPWLNKRYNKILLDPPRSGAEQILQYFKKIQAEKIIYVSCHPATLARDAGILVNQYGYSLTQAGIMDMFPHTAHVESIAVFEKS